jgi:hypothetical protein
VAGFHLETTVTKFRNLIVIPILLLAACSAFASVAVSVNVRNIATTAPTTSITVRFQLQNCTGNIPRVISSGVIVQAQYDFKPDAAGLVTGTIYGNDEIDCGGYQNSVYAVIYLKNGIPLQPSYTYLINAESGTFNPATAVPTSSVPAVYPPDGDTTYIRLDGGNSTSAVWPLGIANTWSAAQTFAVVNGIYGISDFGIKCDGTTDDTVGLNLIGSSAPAAGYTVSFPSNATCVHSGSITTWRKANLRIIGNGARLKFTGSGKQIYFTGAFGSEVDNVHIEGFTLQGNALSTWGFYEDVLLARSEIHFINIQDQSVGCAYLADVQLMNNVDISCSNLKATQMGTSQTTVPVTGVQAGDTLLPFSNNRKVNLTVEGVSGVGLWCKNCGNGNLFVGTSEHNGTGVKNDGGPGTGTNTFVAFDTELNSVADLIENSVSNTYIGCIMSGTVQFNSAAAIRIIGGGWGDLTDVGGTSQDISLDGTSILSVTMNWIRRHWRDSEDRIRFGVEYRRQRHPDAGQQPGLDS